MERTSKYVAAILKNDEKCMKKIWLIDGRGRYYSFSEKSSHERYGGGYCRIQDAF